ncbi:hypothetical protein EN45_042730 [Penicillium chrysogenum]|uniref:Uncharacterized protein n=1 Tax=Penicillium chrysogenum TaxID=5076 RepID=A0A167YGA7_PENCH|nr:hypothetical protein HAV15_012277 [Penicillium sp. str. \
MALVTIRVKYELTDDSGIEIGDVVRAAIFLGRGQVDMAVEPHGVDQVNQHFTTLSCSRFSKPDLLFAPEHHHIKRKPHSAYSLKYAKNTATKQITRCSYGIRGSQIGLQRSSNGLTSYSTIIEANLRSRRKAECDKDGLH